MPTPTLPSPEAPSPSTESPQLPHCPISESCLTSILGPRQGPQYVSHAVPLLFKNLHNGSLVLNMSHLPLKAFCGLP